MFCCSHHPATVTPLVESEAHCSPHLSASYCFAPEHPDFSLPSAFMQLQLLISPSHPGSQPTADKSLSSHHAFPGSALRYRGARFPRRKQSTCVWVCLCCLLKKKKKKQKPRFNISLLLLLILLVLPPQLQEEAKRQRAPAAAAQRVPGQPAGAARLPQRHLPPAAAPGPGARRSRPPQPRRGRPRPHVQPRAGSPHRAAAAAGTATVPS